MVCESHFNKAVKISTGTVCDDQETPWQITVFSWAHLSVPQPTQPLSPTSLHSSARMRFNVHGTSLS